MADFLRTGTSESKKRIDQPGQRLCEYQLILSRRCREQNESQKNEQKSKEQRDPHHFSILPVFGVGLGRLDATVQLRCQEVVIPLTRQMSGRKPRDFYSGGFRTMPAKYLGAEFVGK